MHPLTAKVPICAAVLLCLSGCSVEGDAGTNPVSGNPFGDESGSLRPGTMQALADPAPMLAEQPVLELLPGEVDLGTMQASAVPVEINLTLRNCGKVPLRIAGVTTSCGCLVTAAPRGLLESGETEALVLTLRPSEPGYHRKVVGVTTNLPTVNAATAISWTSENVLTARPAVVALGAVRVGQPVLFTVELQAPDGTQVRDLIERIESQSGIRVKLRASDRPESAALDITVDSGEEPKRRDSEILIHGKPPLHELRIPVSWNAIHGIQLAPAARFLGRVAPGEDWTATCVLTDLDKQTVNVETTNPSVLVETAGVIESGKVVCKLSGSAPDSQGPFSIDIPLVALTHSDSEHQIRFRVSGVVVRQGGDQCAQEPIK